MSPYGFMVIIPQSPSKLPPNGHLGRRHDDGDTTTAVNEGISVFPNDLGRGKPFLLLYLPFCVSEGPVSSVSCRHGAFIFSCSCAGNDRRDAIGSYQWHFDGCKYCFTKNQQKALNVQEDGYERGEMQQSNGDWKGWG